MLNKLLILPLFFISTVLIGQTSQREVFKLKAISMAELSAKTDYEWSDWRSIDQYVIINTKIGRINITGSDKLFFEVLDSEVGTPTQKNAVAMTTFQTYDAFGDRCEIDLIAFEDNSLQMYFNYSKLRYVFELRSMQ